MARWSMVKAKRKIEPIQSAGPAAPAAPGKRGCTHSFLNQKNNETGEVCTPTQAQLKEEYVQPEEEKESGGEG
jgi:hypothetical protein